MKNLIIKNTIFRIFILLALTVLLMPIFSASAQTTPKPTGPKSIEMKYAGWFPKGQMMERMPAYWAEEVIKRTNGRIKVTNHYAQSLGKFSDFPDMILGGTCDLGFVMAMSKGFELLGANELPFLISKTAVSMDVAQGLYRLGLFSSIFEKSGFKTLYFQPTDPFYFFFVNKKVTNLNELRPLKLRGATPPQLQVIKALGASGVSIPTADLYMALDRRTVDGLITAPELVLSSKLYEILKYCAWESVGTPSGAVVMNLNVWNSLPPDIQVIIEELNQEIRYKFMDMQKSAEEYRKELTKHGVTIYELSLKEVDLWRTMAEPLIKDWIEARKAKGQPSQEIVDVIYKIVKHY